MPARRGSSWLSLPLSLYKDPAERRWAAYGRWLAWFRKDRMHVLASLGGMVALALVEWPENLADDALDLLVEFYTLTLGG